MTWKLTVKNIGPTPMANSISPCTSLESAIKGSNDHGARANKRGIHIQTLQNGHRANIQGRSIVNQYSNNDHIFTLYYNVHGKSMVSTFWW